MKHAWWLVFVMFGGCATDPAEGGEGSAGETEAPDDDDENSDASGDGESGSGSGSGSTGGGSSEGGSETGGGGELQAGDLLITEIMANPPNIQDDHFALMWGEIHNPTDADIDLQGLEIGLIDQFRTVDESIVVEAGGYVLIGGSTDRTQNGDLPVQWEWRGNLGTAAGTITIRTADEFVIDVVDYWLPEFEYAESGWGFNLDPGSFDHLANDIGANWCPAVQVWDGEPRATPGAPNEACP